MQSERRAELYASLALTRVRVAKVLALVRHPSAWSLAARGLRQGVFPSFEHADVPFGASFRTVVDVGTSTGQFALFALWRFPDAHLICFEPLPGSASVAQRVLPGTRARVHQAAVG